MGGHEADGDGGSFLETQMLRFGNDEFGERDDITGKAGRSQGDYLISRLEAVDSRADGDDNARALAAQRAGIARI